MVWLTFPVGTVEAATSTVEADVPVRVQRRLVLCVEVGRHQLTEQTRLVTGRRSL